MIDFDELDGAEEAREEEDAPLRAAMEAETVNAEEAGQWIAKVVGGLRDTSGLAPLVSRPEDPTPIGFRRVGDTLRLVRKERNFALLHPLELARVAADYQDYWHAVLSQEVPRRSTEVWISTANLAPLNGGSGGFQEIQAGSAISEPLLVTSANPSDQLTIIVSTSPVKHHCNSEMMLQVLHSLQANEALKDCQKLLVFDAPPSEAEVKTARKNGALAEGGSHWVPQVEPELLESYKRYQEKLKLAAKMGHKSMHKVKLLFMPAWGHLVGTVRFALEHILTPFILLHQHDLLLAETFTSKHVAGILRTLAEQKANYVILNRDVNFVSRSTQYFQAAPHRLDQWRVFVREHSLQLDEDKKTSLTPFVGFSDQTHFASTEWYRQRVLPMVGDRKCCMEFAVYEIMLLAWLHDHRCWERTYLFGGMTAGPFIYDMGKNGNCWAQVDDAYSDDKLEEIYSTPEDWIMQPGRPFRCLALYTWTKDEFPSTMEHFPDPHADENRICLEDFDLQGTMRCRRPAGFFRSHAPTAEPVG